MSSPLVSSWSNPKHFNPPQSVSCIFRITAIKVLLLCRPSGIFIALEHKDPYLRDVGPKYLLSFPKEDLCTAGWFLNQIQALLFLHLAGDQSQLMPQR